MGIPDLGFVHTYEPGGPRTILALHGTGGDEHDLVPLAHALDPYAAILSPRGKVIEQGMPRFFRRFAPGVFDVDDLKARTVELAEFVRAAAGAYGFDPRVWAVGYSNGANIAASLLLLWPEVLAGAVLFRPSLPLEVESPPPIAGVPVLILSAERDEYSSPEQVRRLEQLLAAGGARVEVHQADAGHSLIADDFDTARNWMRANPR